MNEWSNYMFFDYILKFGILIGQMLSSFYFVLFSLNLTRTQTLVSNSSFMFQEYVWMNPNMSVISRLGKWPFWYKKLAQTYLLTQKIFFNNYSPKSFYLHLK